MLKNFLAPSKWSKYEQGSWIINRLFKLIFAFISQGVVYVKCSNAEVAASASKALHGRWFAGKWY